MANVGKSIRPFKRYPKIVPDTAYPAGRLKSQVPSWVRPRVDSFPVPAKTSRDAMVMFACKHCPGVGLTRFDHLEDGTAKSCGCLEGAAYRGYYDRKLAEIHPRQRKETFRDCYFHGATRAAAMHRLEKPLVDWVKRASWDRLRSILAKKQDEIHQAAQLSTAAAERYGYNRAEILAICKLANERQASDTAKAQAAWNALSEEERKRAIECASGCKSDMAEANNRILVKSRLSDGQHRVFSQKEFSTNPKKKCRYRWLLEVTDILPPSVAILIFGTCLIRFRLNVNRTLRSRKWWAMEYRAAAKAGIKQLKRPAVKCADFEIPKISPAAIAGHLMNYATYPALPAAA